MTEKESPAASRPVQDEIGHLLDADSSRPVPVPLPASGSTVVVRAYQRRETRFVGDRPANFGTVPNKVAVDLNGVAVYPEFAIVRRLEAAGWRAVWRKNWHGAAFWSDIDVVAEVPSHVMQTFDAIAGVAGAGAWDVLAWKGARILFIESKKYGSDSLTLNQRRWLETALDQGVPIESFAIYEYVA
jgi:hypothetical protein